MVIVFFWVCFAIIVGVAANTRGRSGLGWFLLAVIISPLLAGLFVLALPRLEGDVDDDELARNVRREQKATALASNVFEPDGVYAGIPYRISDRNSVDAMMPHGLVRFRNMEHFTAAAKGKTAP